jgi:hypothetical protein
MPKKTKPLPSIDYLHKLFEYRDGELYWKVTKAGGRRPGMIAGSINGNGYRIVGIDYRKYQVHRIVWALCGQPEAEYLDHINGDKTDNRIENLRAASIFENNRNIGLKRNNTSGFKGVSWNKQAKKWVGQVLWNHKNHLAGFFEDKEQCAKAVRELREKLHGEFARH